MRGFIIIGLLALAGSCHAAFSTETDKFLQVLGSALQRTTVDLECVKRVGGAIGKVTTTGSAIKYSRKLMDNIDSGFKGVSIMMKLAKYLPTIGNIIGTLQTAIQVAKTPFNTAYVKIKAIDDRIKPSMDKIGKVEKAFTAMRAILTTAQHSFKDRGDKSSGAKTCVSNMPAGALKTQLEGKLETMGSAQYAGFAHYNNVVGAIGHKCGVSDQYTTAINGWGDVQSIQTDLQKVTNFLKPVLDFFGKIQAGLNKRLCIPNPFEAIKELEIVEEIAEGLKSVASFFRGWGKRRRRSLVLTDKKALKKTLASLRVTRDQANSWLIEKRASNICFSIQQILDGIDSVFGLLVNMANKFIAKLLSFLPSFNLPGLPNFSFLDGINPIHFQIADPAFGGFSNQAMWDQLAIGPVCAEQVKQVCTTQSGSVTTNCAATMGNFGKRSATAPAPVLTSKNFAGIEMVDADTFNVEITIADSERTRGDDKVITAEKAIQDAANLNPDMKKILLAKIQDIIPQ